MTRYLNNINLPDNYDIQQEEKKILKFWHKEKILENIKATRREKNNGIFTFHSGPVFPTGSPHAGHIYNGLIKDVFTRYGYQQNLQVESRFGWDCHGLAVEHEVDKKLDIRSAGDIQKMGIPAYNEECRRFVERNSSEWKNVFERTGNWVDFSKEYKTMDTEYMECVWKVFKQLYDKGLVYKATKVLPYSTACFTHLSNFEAAQNCKEVTEVGVTISVDIVDSDEKLLIWTTKPSTLVSNSAVCVNPKAVYLKVKANDVVYILAKNCLPMVFKNSSEYSVIEELTGKSLHKLRYEPLFKPVDIARDFTVLLEDCVSDTIGTGIVPLDEVVLESLNERRHVLKTEEVTYKKAHCWRSDTPLIDKRVESWFIRVEAIKEELLQKISEVNWYPDNDVKEKLKENIKDWAVSRTRTWGTPIPIWSSISGDEVVCVGSIEELKQLTGKTNITDLHREYVDWMVIPSATPGNPPLRRVSQVFDCWFESGALSFVNHHLTEPTPFQLDLAVEGRDQAYGWFYTMLVLSTSLNQSPPFRNILSTGLIRQPDGSKVSKRKHNQTDIQRLVDRYGADSVRLYLLSLDCGEDFAIQEEGVARIFDTVIQQLYKIFHKCTSQLGRPSWVNYGYITDWYGPKNPIDAWILSCTESLLEFHDIEMKAFRVHTIFPRVVNLIEQVIEWYIPARCPCVNPAIVDTHQSSCVLFNVIYRLCLVLVPLTPFFTEYVYQIYRVYLVFYLRYESIHTAPLIVADKAMIKPEVEKRVHRMQEVIKRIRSLRVRHIIPIEYLINEVVVIHRNDDFLQDIETVKEYITKLANVRNVTTSKDHREYGATQKISIRPTSEFRGNEDISAVLQDLYNDKVELSIQNGSISILQKTIPIDDLEFNYHLGKEPEANYAIVAEQDLMVVVKMNKGLFYYEEGTFKAVASCIKNIKKKANYFPNEHASLHYSTKDECLQHLMSKHKGRLEQTVKCYLNVDKHNSGQAVDDSQIEAEVDIKGLSMKMYLYMKSDK